MPNATVKDFYFQFTLIGHIESVDGENYLVCRDDQKFRLRESPEDYPQGIALWHVIPSTDSTGVLTSLNVESYEIANTDDLEEKCFLSGRIVQIGKRGQVVQFKVTRSGEKNLKISFLSPNPHMKIGQLWQVVAVRIGDMLHIQTANALAEGEEERGKRGGGGEGEEITAVQEPRRFSSFAESKATKLPNERVQSAAIAALIAETQVSNWELGIPKQRTHKSWEWEAISKTTQISARVRVWEGRRKSLVYQYPSHSQVKSLPQATGNNRLVVTPLGAALGIGASCFRVEIGPYEIVLDCGTRPKGYNPLPALEYLENPDLLLISHAHQDHLGAVPVFHSRWPGVRTICTVATREIAHVMLQDCLKVQQLSEDSPQLFDEADLERTLFRLETQPIGSDFEPLPGLNVRFINAGHILGAACIYLQYGKRTLLYTGDYNTTSSRSTTGLNLSDLPKADLLITESTYGADVHPARRTQETALLEAIASVTAAGGNVLIPAFALGRAQEILLTIRTSNLFHKLKVPVYVDGLVRAVTDVFRDNLDLLPATIQNLVSQNGVEPFFDPQGTPPIIPISSPQERPLAMAKPSVIVASSGMLTGGPSVYYAKTLLERENAAVLISGYTDEESPGRLLQSLQTGDTIELDGKELTVRAQIKRFNLSGHADKVGLGQVISKVNPKHLILIHGSANALHDLARSGDFQSKYYIHIPSVGERIEYGLVPEHLSQAQIAKIELPPEFEVTVEAEVEGAWLRIPASVVEVDPRWQILASSGILRAKWDGFHLKLSPLTTQFVETLQATQAAIAAGEDCCAVCQFFKSDCCRCEESSLFGLQVDPTGKCTEFSSRGEGE